MTAATDDKLPPDRSWNLEIIVLGMVGGLTDAEDPAAAQASLQQFERRGQRLAVFAPLLRGAPRYQAGKTVPRQPLEAERAVPRQPFEAKSACSSTVIG